MDSATIAEVTLSSSSPPYASGMSTLIKPSSPALRRRLRVTAKFLASISAAAGITSFVVNSMTVLAICRCSSEKSSGVNISCGSRSSMRKLPPLIRCATVVVATDKSYNRYTLMSIRPEDALEYHASAPAGKVSVVPTKPCRTQRDLSLAYSPGVAVPCLAIEKDPALAYAYTAKANLVGVVSNGTAVLGLGNIGALAGKPVMEGKGVLFKRFADIDVFDIELDTENADEVIRTCQILEPTFGGINLEDIKAPECFYIEET